MKDRFQVIIWVGADGQGLYMYLQMSFLLTNIMLDVPEYRVDNPVRAPIRIRSDIVDRYEGRGNIKDV